MNLADRLRAVPAVQYLFAGMALFGFLLFARWLWTPSVQPVLPAELESSYSALTGTVASPSQAPLDFIFRPLFNSSRAPRDNTAPVKAEEPVSSPELVVVDMSGYQLMGTFASEGREGVILKTKDGDRQRLLIGQVLDGWELDAVNARSGLFTNQSGEIAELGLALAMLPEQRSVMLNPPSGALGDEASPSAVNPDQQGSAEKASPPAPTTFDEVWERRRQESEASQATRAAAEGANGDRTREVSRERNPGKKKGISK